MIKRVKIILITAVVVVLVGTAHAQFNVGGPGTIGSATNANGTKSNDANNSPAVPFDGGMSLILIASGVGLGVKKLRT